MTFLKREDLLKKQDLRIEKVDLGEGDYVFVREMTGRERDQFEKSIFSFDQKALDLSNKEQRKIATTVQMEDYKAKLAVCCVCDQEGTLIFEFDDYEQLSQNMSAYKLDKIATVAQRLSRITAEDREELLGNSGGGPAADSNSDSVEN